MSLKPGEIEKYIGAAKLPKIAITKHKLWEEPKDAPALQQELEAVPTIEINPSDIVKWAYKDRPENELGDLEEFAQTLKTIGQLQPGIVRPSKIPDKKYELIVGERRWLACKIAGIPFQAKVVEYSDSLAGLAQAIENEKRKDLSDYAKGMSYANKIKAGIFTQSDLIERLGKSKQDVSRLLAYKDIPSELVEAIGDMRKVSPYTAELLKSLCRKHPENTALLIKFAESIAKGVGVSSVNNYIKKAKLNSIEFENNEKVFSTDGRHLFTWRKDGNGQRSISFPKDIRELINTRNLEQSLKQEIESQLSLLKSPDIGTKKRGIKMNPH